MSAVAFVSFDGFYAACIARKEPALARAAVAVLRSKKVLDASQPARRLGIHPGLATQEARYAARGASVRFINFQEGDYVQESRQWLDVCTEYTTIIEPTDPHSAFLDLSALAGAREMAVPLAADIYSALRLCPRIGIASGKLAAKLASEPIYEGGDRAFLAPLSLDSLWLAEQEHLKRLSFLGYRTIEDVAKLPLELLQKQFGQAGLQLSLWAKGIDRSPVRALYPPDELSARFNFPQPARLDAELEMGLQILANRLGTILQTRDQQTTAIELHATFENQMTQKVQRTFVKPMQSPGALLTGLRLTLRLVSLNSEVHSIYAKFPQVTKADRKQLALSTETKDGAAVETTLRQLQETFGKESIKRADKIILPRRQHLLKAYE